MSKKNKVMLVVLLVILAFSATVLCLKKTHLPARAILRSMPERKHPGNRQSAETSSLPYPSWKSLNLDDSLFKDPIFNNLSDFSIPLIPQEVGRSNPFSPIGGSANPDNGGPSGDKKTKN